MDTLLGLKGSAIPLRCPLCAFTRTLGGTAEGEQAIRLTAADFVNICGAETGAPTRFAILERCQPAQERTLWTWSKKLTKSRCGSCERRSLSCHRSGSGSSTDDAIGAARHRRQYFYRCGFLYRQPVLKTPSPLRRDGGFSEPAPIIAGLVLCVPLAWTEALASAAPPRLAGRRARWPAAARVAPHGDPAILAV